MAIVPNTTTVRLACRYNQTSAMPTIYDVAKRAGVSTYTVSSVLNRSAIVSPKLTKRVMDAVKELDYTINDVARSLQTRKTQTVGMLIAPIMNASEATPGACSR